MIDNDVIPVSSAWSKLLSGPALMLLGGVFLWFQGTAAAEEKIEDLLKRDRCETRSSISSTIQLVLEKEIAQARVAFGPTAAWALLSNIQTGEILGYSEQGNVSRATPPAHAVRDIRVPELNLISIAVGMDAGIFDLDAKVDLRTRKGSPSGDSFLDRWGTVRETFTFASSSDGFRLLLQHEQSLKPVLQDVAIKAERQLDARPKQAALSGISAIHLGYGVQVSPLVALAMNGATIVDGKLSPLSFDRSPPAGCNSSPTSAFVQPKTSFAIRSLLKLNGQIGTVKKANASAASVGGEAGVLRSNHDRAVNFFLGAFPIDAPDYQLFVGLEDAKATRDTFGFSSPSWNVVPVAGKLIARLLPLLIKTVPADSSR